MNSKDHRQYPRYETEIMATVFTKDDKISATMIDIGKGGFGVISEKKIDPGNKVYISLKFLNEYAIHGIIKWSKQTYQDQNIFYRMGIKADKIVWTDLRAIGFPEWDELVEKIVTGTEKQKGKTSEKR